jgi:gas vesicle protein
MSENNIPQSESDYENESSAHRPWGFLAGVVFGGLAVAAAMLMLAPQSGKRISAKMLRKSIKLRDLANEAVEDAKARTRAVNNQVQVGMRRNAREIQHRGQEIIDEQMERISKV